MFSKSETSQPPFRWFVLVFWSSVEMLNNGLVSRAHSRFDYTPFFFLFFAACAQGDLSFALRTHFLTIHSFHSFREGLQGFKRHDNAKDIVSNVVLGIFCAILSPRSQHCWENGTRAMLIVDLKIFRLNMINKKETLNTVQIQMRRFHTFLFRLKFTK